MRERIFAVVLVLCMYILIFVLVLPLSRKHNVCEHEIAHYRARIDTLRTEISLLQDSILALLLDPDMVITGAHLVLNNGDTIFSGYIPYPDSVVITKNP